MGLESLRCHAPLRVNANLVVGSGIITFTRSSLGTFHKNGIVNYAGLDVLRFGDTGFVVEGPSTNVVLDSNSILDAGANWAGIDVTSTGGEPAPDLTTDASLIVPNTNNTTHSMVSALISIANGSLNTFSIYADPTGNNWLQIYSEGSFGWNGYVNFNISTGTVGTTSSATGKITLMADGYYRCEATFTGTLAFAFFSFSSSPSELGSAGASFIGNDVDGAVAWGAQAEKLGFSTSLIVTGASTVTRAEDQPSYTPANWPAVDTTFTVAVNINNKMSDAAAGTVLSLEGLTGSNTIGVDATDQFELQYGGVTSVDAVTSSIVGNTRVIATWDTATNQLLYTDKILQDTDATVNAGGALTEIRLGRIGVASGNFYGEISNLRIYDDALTQDEINSELFTQRLRKLTSSISIGL